MSVVLYGVVGVVPWKRRFSSRPFVKRMDVARLAHPPKHANGFGFEVPRSLQGFVIIDVHVTRLLAVPPLDEELLTEAFKLGTSAEQQLIKTDRKRRQVRVVQL